MADLTINKVQLTPEVVDDFRLQFGQDASSALAKDLIDTFRASDYQTQVTEDNNFFNFDSLSDGTAGFYDQLDPQYTMPVMRNGEEVMVPIRDMLPAERKVRFNDPDAISALLSNAERGSLPGAAFSEFFKTAPSVFAGTRAAQATAARTFRRPPTNLPQFFLQATPPALAFIGGSLLLYEGADALEELALGPDKVILPGQKQAIEAARTAGGSVAGIQFPFLLRQSTNRGARDLLLNLAEGAPRSIATRMTAAAENLIESAAKTAKSSKTAAGLTGAAELVAGAGATIGAYQAEGMAPGQTGPRLFGELLGGGTFAATFSRMLPRVYKAVDDTVVQGDAGAGIIEKLRQGKQAKLFRRIDELYTKYDGDYERMMDDLSNEETNAILAEVFPGVDFTAAQRLDDNTGILMGLEAGMAKDNPDLASARARADRQARAFMLKFIHGLQEQGDEESLRAAALLRTQMFRDGIQGRLRNAVDKRVAAVNQIGDTSALRAATPELEGVSGQQGFSVLLADTLDKQLEFARGRERALWGDVGGFDVFDPQDVIDTGEAPKIISEFDRFLAEMHPSYRTRFLQENRELADAVKTMKRNLGLDIREDIIATQGIIDSVDKINTTPSALIGTQIEGQIAALARADAIPPANTVEGLQARMAVFDEAIDRLDRLNMFVGAKPNAGYDMTESIANIRRQGREPTADLLLEDQFFTVKMGTPEEAAQFKAVLQAKRKLLELEALRLNPERLKPVTADELYMLRSELLNDAATAASGQTQRRGVANEARRLGELAESILDDLSAVPDGANEAYDIARAYSFALNDAFTRSIVGGARAQNMMGARRIPPELLSQQFIRGNPDVVNLRIHQLQGVAEFAAEQGFEGADRTFTTINNVMEAALRDARKSIMYPEGSAKAGQVNPEALAKWKRDNAETLAVFPNLAQDLDNALTAQRTFEHYTRRARKSQEIADSQSYLATLLGNTSPTMAISDALMFTPKGGRQADPVQGLRRLFRLTSIKYRGPDGKALPRDQLLEIQNNVKSGYLNAAMQFALMKAGGESTTFDPVTFHRTLFEALPNQGAGKRSLMSLMEDYGVIDAEQVRRIRTVSNQMVRLAAADAAGKLDDPELIKEAGPIFDFYVGMVGLAGGTRAYQALTGGQGGTASISAASFTKGIVLDLFRDMPASKRMEAQQLIFTDPELAATLIRAPKTEKEAIAVGSKIANIFAKNGFAITGGMSPYVVREMGEDQDVGTGRDEPIPTPTGGVGDQSSVRPELIRPEPIPAQPAAQPTTALASAAPVQQPAPSGPVDRSRYAALFPNDMASGMIKQQGIGSLFG